MMLNVKKYWRYWRLKIPDIITLATKTALNAVENEKPSVSNLVKKNWL